MNIGGELLLNTHSYDGKIVYTIEFFHEEMKKIRLISVDDKNRSFDELRTFLIQNKHTTQNTMICFNSIVSNILSNTNYDGANNLYADDILYLIFMYILDELGENKDKLGYIDRSEYLILLAQQLDDMISGQCSQGKSTRLMQVLLLKLNNIENA